jgi:hypothetical protein
MHGPADARQARWFLARLNDGDTFWSITEPGTPHFVAAAARPEDSVEWMAATSRAIDPVIEKMDTGNPDGLPAEINHWTPQRVLDENKAMHAEVDALRAQQEPLVACVDALRAAASDSGWRDALATGEHLVAWVRRGALREALAIARAEPGVPEGATQADLNAVECARRIADGIEKLMGGA